MTDKEREKDTTGEYNNATTGWREGERGANEKGMMYEGRQCEQVGAGGD